MKAFIHKSYQFSKNHNVLLALPVLIFLLLSFTKIINPVSAGASSNNGSINENYISFLKKSGLWDHFSKKSGDLSSLTGGLAEFNRQREISLRKGKGSAKFWAMRSSSEKDRFYRDPDLVTAKDDRYPAMKIFSLFYNAAGNRLSRVNGNRRNYLNKLVSYTGNRLIDYSISPIPKHNIEKEKAFHVEISDAVSTGKINFFDIRLLVESFYRTIDRNTSECGEKALGEKEFKSKKTDACFWSIMENKFPNLARYVQKNFVIHSFGKRVKENGRYYFQFDLKLALRKRQWKKSYPKTWAKSAYILKNLEYQIYFRDYYNNLLGGFRYNRKTRSWNLRFNMRGRNILTYHNLKKSFVLSKITRKRFYWDIAGKFNLYGIHISWKGLRLLADYHKHRNSDIARFTWLKSPKMTVKGRLIGIFPPPLVDLVIPGSIDQIIQDYVDTLSGKRFNNPGWNMKIFTTGKGADKNILTIQTAFDTVQNGFFTFFSKRRAKRKLGDIPSFSESFFRAISLDSK